MRKLIKKFIKGYFVLIVIMLTGSALTFLFNSCSKESYYDEENSIDHTVQLDNFKKSMQIAGKDFKKHGFTKKSFDSNPNNEEVAEQFVQQISGAALILIKSYGVTEQDLINHFGSLDPVMISMTAQLIMAEEDLLDEGKTMSIFTQDDYQISSLLLFGVNSTYAGGGSTVGGCLLEAIGVKAVVNILVGDLAALGTAGVLKIVGNVASKYAGVIGGAVMVYQFADCMGYFNKFETGGPGGVSSINDLVLIKPVEGYFNQNYIYISKKDLNYVSISNFQIDQNFLYPIYLIHADGPIPIDGPFNGTYSFSSEESIYGFKLDGSTIMELTGF